MKTLRIFIVLVSVYFLTGCATVEKGLETMHNIQKAAGQVPVAQIHITNAERIMYAGVDQMGINGYNSEMVVLEPGQSNSFTVFIYKENVREIIRVKFYEYDPRKKNVDFKEVVTREFWFSSYNNQDQYWDARR